MSSREESPVPAGEVLNRTITQLVTAVEQSEHDFNVWRTGLQEVCFRVPRLGPCKRVHD